MSLYPFVFVFLCIVSATVDSFRLNVEYWQAPSVLIDYVRLHPRSVPLVLMEKADRRQGAPCTVCNVLYGLSRGPKNKQQNNVLNLKKQCSCRLKGSSENRPFGRCRSRGSRSVRLTPYEQVSLKRFSKSFSDICYICSCKRLTDFLDRKGFLW